MTASCRWTIVLAVLFLSAVHPAFGHKPASIGGTFSTIDQALPMTDIDVSQVVYSPLTAADPQLWLTFEATAGFLLDVSLGIPVLDRLTDYRPTLAVLGPGLPQVDVPFDVPPGMGGIVFESAAAGEPRFFHEPVTGTESWILIKEAVALPETGTVYVVAWSPAATADKLWVAIGTRERFGLGDIVSFPAIIRDARAFHEVSDVPHWSQTFGRIAFAVLGVGIVALVAFGNH